MFFKCLTLVLCVILNPVSANSESASLQKAEEGNPFINDFMSPLNTEARSLLLYGSAFTLGLAILERSISDPIQKGVISHKALGSFSEYGDLAGQMYPNLFYSLGMLFHGMLTGKERSYDRSKLMFKATFYSSLVTTGLKYTVQQPRPDGSNRESFPSGHTTTAFAFASVVGAEHEWQWGTLAYAMAAFVGFSRMNDNNHFLHDVIGGAVIGSSYGLALYYKQEEQKRAKQSESQTEFRFQVLPTDDLSGAIVLYSTNLSF